MGIAQLLLQVIYGQFFHQGPIEDTESVLLAISNASISIKSSYSSPRIMSASGSVSDVLSLGFEDKLLISPVYQRAQRFDLGFELSEDSSNSIYGGSGAKEQSLKGLTQKASPSMRRTPLVIRKTPPFSVGSHVDSARGQCSFDTTPRHVSFPGSTINHTEPTEVDGQPGLIPVEGQSLPNAPHKQYMSVPVNGRCLPATINPPNLNEVSHPKHCILSLGQRIDFFLHDSAHTMD